MSINAAADEKIRRRVEIAHPSAERIAPFVNSFVGKRHGIKAVAFHKRMTAPARAMDVELAF